MKKNIIAILLSFCLIAPAFASVRLVSSDESSSQNRGTLPNLSSLDTKALCKKEGFETTSCSAGLALRLQCPYSGEYYKGCCDPKYNYTKPYCYEQDMIPSTDDCFGFHYCIDKDQPGDELILEP